LLSAYAAVSEAGGEGLRTARLRKSSASRPSCRQVANTDIRIACAAAPAHVRLPPQALREQRFVFASARLKEHGPAPSDKVSNCRREDSNLHALYGHQVLNLDSLYFTHTGVEL